MPVKPLSFKGDKARPKKRKHRETVADSTDLTSHSEHPSTAQGDEDDDDSWVDPDAAGDLSGPMILVLPTEPHTCLASDAHGNVFASPLENMVENNPTTAEPHDVRQVWVVGKVAGMADGEISLKGSHGGFLSCDEMGILGARREARGFEETFKVELIPVPERIGKNRGMWRMKTAAKTKDGVQYLSAIVEGASDIREKDEGQKRVSVLLRGDGEKESQAVQLVLRMQARFKPKLQQDKEQKKSEKVSRAELERIVGRKLDESEVKRLKRAKKDGTYYEEILDVRVKGKHDKYA